MSSSTYFARSSRSSRGFYSRVKGIMKHRKYSRLGDDAPLLFHVAPKIKIFRFSRKPNRQGILGQGVGVAPTKPTILGRLRDKYMTLITKVASKASSTSLAHVAKPKTAQTLTLGFSRKADTVEDLGFKLSKNEIKYLEHLRRSAAESRGGYSLGLRL